MDSGLAWSGQQYSSPQWSKFVALQVHKITTTVMTYIIVHSSTHYAKLLLIS